MQMQGSYAVLESMENIFVIFQSGNVWKKYFSGLLLLVWKNQIIF